MDFIGVVPDPFLWQCHNCTVNLETKLYLCWFSVFLKLSSYALMHAKIETDLIDLSCQTRLLSEQIRVDTTLFAHFIDKLTLEKAFSYPSWFED